MGVQTGLNTAGGDKEHGTQLLNRELRVAALDDLRAGLLRGRDDAHRHAAV